MKVGIIVYSKTGNTYDVAKRLEERLREMKYQVNLERIELVDDNVSAENDVIFKKSPIVDKYDVIFFGAPVQAFSLCIPMKAYLKQISSLEKKQTGFFTTEAFPYPWMGGNRAIKKMKSACQEKGATIIETGVINWNRKEKEELINKLIENLSQSIKKGDK